MRWQQIDLTSGIMQVNRRKNGFNSVHPLFGPELRALRKIKRAYPQTDYVFISERGSPMIDSMFRKIIARAGVEAKLGLPVHIPTHLDHQFRTMLITDSNPS